MCLVFWHMYICIWIDQMRFIYQCAEVLQIFESTVDSYCPLECFMWNMQMPSEVMVNVFFNAGDTSFPF